MTNYLQTFLLRLFGIVFLITFLYLRFIRTRMLLELYFIKIREDFSIEINIYLFLTCLVFFILFLIGIIITIKQILNQPITIPNNMVTRLLGNIIFFIKQALTAVEEVIGNNIDHSYEKLRDLILNFYKNYGYKEKQMILLFVGFPYLSVSCIFLFEILYTFKLYWFYTFLPLLFIPLLFSLWIYLIEKLVHNLNEIEKLFIVSYKKLPNGQDQVILHIKPNINYKDIDIIQYNNEYLLLMPLKGFIESYHKAYALYATRFRLLMYFLFFLGWAFVLFHNFFLFL